jgi:hypothetical protein
MIVVFPPSAQELVFSDEFATSGRTFGYDAADRRWLAMVRAHVAGPHHCGDLS